MIRRANGRPDARQVHFDAEIIVVAVVSGNLRRGFAHASADFENFRGISPVDRNKVNRLCDVDNANLRHQFGVVALLRFRHATGTAHVTLDVAVNFAGPAGVVNAVAHDPMSPLVGDDGSAEYSLRGIRPAR